MISERMMIHDTFEHLVYLDSRVGQRRRRKCYGLRGRRRRLLLLKHRRRWGRRLQVLELWLQVCRGSDRHRLQRRQLRLLLLLLLRGRRGLYHEGRGLQAGGWGVGRLRGGGRLQGFSMLAFVANCYLSNFALSSLPHPLSQHGKASLNGGGCRRRVGWRRGRGRRGRVHCGETGRVVGRRLLHPATDIVARRCRVAVGGSGRSVLVAVLLLLLKVNMRIP